ncbi:MAG: bifunctional oligoribonuclease/PAP phosphatase NrnA [Firmicutes bacterium]|nr:bifunctional oligoribonuclease/PAP phosphatase NrnA [Bacillota bacterium]
MLNKIAQNIITAKSIAVICHIRPDADTFGSALGLYNGLSAIDKRVELFVDDDLPQRYAFIKNYNKFNTTSFSQNYDAVISVDSADVERLGKFGKQFLKHKNSINLDHHITNTHYAKYNFVKADYSSSCEVILDLIEILKIPLNFDIALSLYSGLSTDTGNFSFSNTNERTFSAALKLIKYIGDISSYVYNLYKKTSLNRTMLLAKVLSNIKMYSENKIAILYTRYKDLADMSVPSFDTEGFVDYAINIEGVKVGCSILENKPESFKISMRSREKDVSKICEHFGGGGHKFASGCKIDGFFEDVLDELVRAIANAIE